MRSGFASTSAARASGGEQSSRFDPCHAGPCRSARRSPAPGRSTCPASAAACCADPLVPTSPTTRNGGRPAGGAGRRDPGQRDAGRTELRLAGVDGHGQPAAADRSARPGRGAATVRGQRRERVGGAVRQARQVARRIRYGQRVRVVRRGRAGRRRRCGRERVAAHGHRGPLGRADRASGERDDGEHRGQRDDGGGPRRPHGLRCTGHPGRPFPSRGNDFGVRRSRRHRRRVCPLRGENPVRPAPSGRSSRRPGSASSR